MTGGGGGTNPDSLECVLCGELSALLGLELLELLALPADTPTAVDELFSATPPATIIGGVRVLITSLPQTECP